MHASSKFMPIKKSMPDCCGRRWSLLAAMSPLATSERFTPSFTIGGSMRSMRGSPQHRMGTHANQRELLEAADLFGEGASSQSMLAYPALQRFSLLVYGRRLVVTARLNRALFAASYVETFARGGSVAQSGDSSRGGDGDGTKAHLVPRHLAANARHCHYIGAVEGDGNSSVAYSICSGAIEGRLRAFGLDLALRRRMLRRALPPEMPPPTHPPTHRSGASSTRELRMRGATSGALARRDEPLALDGAAWPGAIVSRRGGSMSSAELMSSEQRAWGGLSVRGGLSASPSVRRGMLEQVEHEALPFGQVLTSGGGAAAGASRRNPFRDSSRRDPLGRQLLEGGSRPFGKQRKHLELLVVNDAALVRAAASVQAAAEHAAAVINQARAALCCASVLLTRLFSASLFRLTPPSDPPPQRVKELLPPNALLPHAP